MTALLQKAKNTVFGDEKAFKSDKMANCLVQVQENGTFSINEQAMKTVADRFNRVVALIGRAGVGKSTLASSIYNIMREDKQEYFEISDSEESFTRGIWSLNNFQKAIKADKDLLDILDLEGMVNKDATHYLVVIAMALSNAIVLCNNAESGRGRFNFDALNTIIAGLRIYTEYKITLPRPTIYLQVKSGKNKFVINKQPLDRNGFISYIKNKRCTALKNFDVRLFSISDFGDDDRFDPAYVKSVKALINDLTKHESKTEEIKESPEHNKDHNVVVEERVDYAKKMILALNKKSPKMVVALNLKCFKDKVKQIAAECQAQTMKNVQLLAMNARIDRRVSLKEFCNLFCSNKNGRMYYGKQVQVRAKSLSFYDRNDTQFDNHLSKYTSDLSVDATIHCKLIYTRELNTFILQQRNKGEELKEKSEKIFQAAINKEVSAAINEIKFKGCTTLPWKIKERIQKKRLALRNDIIKKTKNVMKDYLDEGDLSMDLLTETWDIEVDHLETDWNTRITEALGSNKQKVTTYGNHICPECGSKYKDDGIRHGKCGKGARYYWVDNETSYCICDTCKELRTITRAACRNCHAILECKIVPMKFL